MPKLSGIQEDLAWLMVGIWKFLEKMMDEGELDKRLVLVWCLELSP